MGFYAFLVCLFCTTFSKEISPVGIPVKRIEHKIYQVAARFIPDEMFRRFKINGLFDPTKFLTFEEFEKFIGAEYDVKNLPWQLNPIAWLVGRWRSEMDGKVRFPTIPTFTYGEQLDITISERPEYGIPSLNYSSHAWGTDKELLHGESGYIAVKHSGYLAMTLTMQNGFVTNEEGRISGNRIYFRMRNIGRLSWSRDLPVLDLRRTFELIDNTTLDQRVRMKTLTKNLQDHAYVRYKKIYP